MNKQELINKLKKLLIKEGSDYDYGHNHGIRQAIIIAKQLDESEKPVVPQFVADWIEWCKKNKITLLGADTAICNNKNIRSLDASGWAMKNQETFAKAWLFGYEIEKEKLYTVKFANKDFGKMYIGIFKKFNKLGISSLPLNDDEVKSWFTEDELKRFKFWNNPAFEIKEVEE